MATATADRLPRTVTGRPKLTRVDDVMRYWAERIEIVSPEREHFSHGSLICESDSIFHYGRHFELGRILRDRRGRARLVLLNGDSYNGPGGWGPSTSSRQSDARRAANRSSAPSLVVPFSALEGAGVDFGSIMPIHVREDRQTTEERSSRTRPAKLDTMDDPSGATKMERYYDYAEGDYREREIPARVPDPNRTGWFFADHGQSEGARLGEDGLWRWQAERHWLGDAVFRARTTETRTRKATAAELTEHEQARAWKAEFDRLQTAGRRIHRLLWELRSGKRDYRRMVRLAFTQQGISQALNEHYERPNPRTSLSNGRARTTVTRWATFLSSFDYQESSPLYFLCELPYGAKPSTVDEAIIALKPPEVIAAEARGLKVIRQGDLFAIPTKLTKRQIRRMRGREDFTKHLRVLGTNHSVTEGIVCKGGAVLGRGIMRHEPEAWRPPDHAQQKLGDTWHLLVRNTVPRTR